MGCSTIAAMAQRATTLVACALSASLWCGCSPYGSGGSFACSTDEQCGGGGTCTNGLCAFPDGECMSGLRYGDFSGHDGLFDRPERHTDHARCQARGRGHLRRQVAIVARGWMGRCGHGCSRPSARSTVILALQTSHRKDAARCAMGVRACRRHAVITGRSASRRSNASGKLFLFRESGSDQPTEKRRDLTLQPQRGLCGSPDGLSREGSPKEGPCPTAVARRAPRDVRGIPPR